ncbi:hypothetical protein [Psychromicrobium sp. YIM B11713]|uniref:hypothetical protein n=1 Tax=Psychromicrobium sp. YIM B11713 TaxID=3145233 RepID=UPI00374E554C
MSETQETKAVSQVSPWAAQSSTSHPSSTVGGNQPVGFNRPQQGSATKASQPGGAVLGPFTARDLVILGSALVIFVGTLLPLSSRGIGNFWNASALFFLGIGILLPLLVVVLLLLHRFKVIGTVRIGTLSFEQFSSVVASFAAAYFFLLTVTGVGEGLVIGPLVALIGSLGFLAATVLAKWIPLLAVAPQDAPAEQPVTASADAPVDIAATTFADPIPAQAAQPASDAPAEPSAEISSAASVAAEWSAAPAVAAPITTAAPVAADVAESASELPAQQEAPLAEPAAESPVTSAEPVLEEQSAAPETNLNPLAHPQFAAAEAESAADVVSAPLTGEAQQGEEAGPELVQQTSFIARPEAAAEDDPLAPAAGSAAAQEEAQEQSGFFAAEPEPKAPESFAATVDPADRPHQNTAGEIVQEAFWFAVDKPKAVVDEHTGGFLYNIEPGSWFLALQDRGYDYLVQSPEGKIGVLRDLRNIERAPQEG